MKEKNNFLMFLLFSYELNTIFSLNGEHYNHKRYDNLPTRVPTEVDGRIYDELIEVVNNSKSGKDTIIDQMKSIVNKYKQFVKSNKFLEDTNYLMILRDSIIMYESKKTKITCFFDMYSKINLAGGDKKNHFILWFTRFVYLYLQVDYETRTLFCMYAIIKILTTTNFTEKYLFSYCHFYNSISEAPVILNGGTYQGTYQGSDQGTDQDIVLQMLQRQQTNKEFSIITSSKRINNVPICGEITLLNILNHYFLKTKTAYNEPIKVFYTKYPSIEAQKVNSDETMKDWLLLFDYHKKSIPENERFRYYSHEHDIIPTPANCLSFINFILNTTCTSLEEFGLIPKREYFILDNTYKVILRDSHAQFTIINKNTTYRPMNNETDISIVYKILDGNHFMHNNIDLFVKAIKYYNHNERFKELYISRCELNLMKTHPEITNVLKTDIYTCKIFLTSKSYNYIDKLISEETLTKTINFYNDIITFEHAIVLYKIVSPDKKKRFTALIRENLNTMPEDLFLDFVLNRYGNISLEDSILKIFLSLFHLT